MVDFLDTCDERMEVDKRCIFKYLQEQYNTVYHACTLSFVLLAEIVPAAFFNEAHHVKATAIGKLFILQVSLPLPLRFRILIIGIGF